MSIQKRDDGVLVMQGFGNTVAYADEDALLGSVWQGDNEIENVQFFNKAFMAVWVKDTIKQIGADKV